MHRPRTAAILLALALAAAPGSARASVFDVEGFGPIGVAEINARAARATDGSAAFYNPGGLGLGSGVGLTLAPTLAYASLSAQKQPLPLTDPFGVALAFDATLPFTGPLKDRIRIGFAGYFQPDGALHLIVRPSTQPLFPYYDNRTQRLVVLPALAVKIMHGLAIGVGLNVLGGVDGPASVLPGATGVPEPRLDLDATTHVAVNAGIRFDPTPGVHFAFAFRQQFAVPAHVTTSAVVGGESLDVTVDAGSALYDPTTLVVAESVNLGKTTVEVDASYSLWSAYQGPFAFVQAELPGVNLVSSLPTRFARDVVSVRGAIAQRFDLGPDSALGLHGGAGFEPSMLASGAQGSTNLVDGDKLFLGVGASIRLRDVIGLHALHFGLGGSAQAVFGVSQTKLVCAAAPCSLDTVAGPDPAHPSVGITNPGYPTLQGGGVFWSTSLGVGAEL